MKHTLNEKSGSGPLLPATGTLQPKRNKLTRRLLVSLGLLIYGAYFWNSAQPFKSKVVAKDTPQCAQSDVLIPEKNSALWESLGATFGTEEFKTRAIDWLGGAVRVPTESYDDLGPVGDDPRWDAFGPFHDYLLGAFPLVHTTLRLTKVNTHGLLYVWQGSDASLKPIVLAAHQDVVPVNPTSVDEWTHPPYSGHFDGRSEITDSNYRLNSKSGERIWGRGSSDDKSGLIGTLASIESLIERGFKPARTVVLSFGFDEEISGRYVCPVLRARLCELVLNATINQGARHLAAALFDLYGQDGVALIVDEGGGFSEQYGTVFATPGIAEKGYIDVRVEVSTAGGHSSIPPQHTSIGILSALLVKYENNPWSVELTRKDPLYSTYQCYAEHGKEFPDELRKTVKRSASSKKALRKLEKEIFKNPAYKSNVGTTQAIDIIGGGVKANALPEQAWAIVNHRIAVTSSVAETQNYDAERLKDLAHKFNLTYEAFGTKLSTEAGGAPSRGVLRLSDARDGISLEPAPVTPTNAHAAPYRLLSGTIKATYNAHRGVSGADNIIVGPGSPSGNTDTRYYWDLTKHIFRYNHKNSGTSTNRLSSGVHTVNEFVQVDVFVEVIRFFTTLILNADESTL
ncbi:hypothetical protein DXG03_005616 [Asterophora parasitica]|uniref:Peptidase M20 dimerisation domain-containing protein n=1 Tax=Asterophora parasitica TaxID=117018 RepID=A0A9P7GE30_9AGAR|nr:hypothetical protein DXG03_005616 [Asterophora parasitica]